MAKPSVGGGVSIPRHHRHGRSYKSIGSGQACGSLSQEGREESGPIVKLWVSRGHAGPGSVLDPEDSEEVAFPFAKLTTS